MSDPFVFKLQPQAEKQKSGYVSLTTSAVRVSNSKKGMRFLRGKNKESLVKQVSDKLDGMFCPGRSKLMDKKNNATRDKIYSYSTLRSYKKHSCYFINWVKEQPVKPEIGHKPRTLDECRPYVEEWLQHRIETIPSAWTVKLDASALAKLYGCSLNDFNVDLPSRKRSDIKRSRGAKERDKHFSEANHSEFVRFCKTTGLRSEGLRSIKGTDLVQLENGTWAISVVEKGGRHRYAPVFGSPEDVAAVVERMKAAGERKVWASVPNGADMHAYRSVYATAIYKRFARPISEIPRSERYDCRNDLKGVHYDRKAMLIASKALGHSRVSVIASHYLRAAEIFED